MSQGPLIYRGEGLGARFATTFLGCNDFTVPDLDTILHRHNMSVSNQRLEKIDTIAWECERSPAILPLIMEQAVARKKTWVHVASITSDYELPRLNNPSSLVIEMGEEEWYGPIHYLGDPDAHWYVKPLFFEHLERDDNNDIQTRKIRWLCFGRIDNHSLSLHWNGFSLKTPTTRVHQPPAQFPYWNYVPDLAREFAELLDVRTSPIRLDDIVLRYMWEKYRMDSDNYIWDDHRIRAEQGGVALSAYSGASFGLDVEQRAMRGIRRLADTISSAVRREFSGLNNGNDDRLTEIILRTLIQDFGAKSYEFSLQSQTGQRLFRAHLYFGHLERAAGPDGFPHLKVGFQWGDNVSQMRFLLDHVR